MIFGINSAIVLKKNLIVNPSLIETSENKKQSFGVEGQIFMIKKCPKQTLIIFSSGNINLFCSY